tara:strand:+ start:254 stop:595 length:342 start_codon:yes stop_codon:yes gene_type:complete
MLEENKRITIQYSIKLGDLASEVERLYAQAADKLKSISLDKAEPEAILDSSVVKKIDQIRQELSAADLMLLDIQSIVGSYIQYEVSLNTPDAPQANAPDEIEQQMVSHVVEPA